MAKISCSLRKSLNSEWTLATKFASDRECDGLVHSVLEPCIIMQDLTCNTLPALAWRSIYWRPPTSPIKTTHIWHKSGGSYAILSGSIRHKVFESLYFKEGQGICMPYDPLFYGMLESEMVAVNRVAAINPPIDDTDPIRKFSLSKREANTEFQHRPQHCRDGHDCGPRFCGRHFRDFFLRGWGMSKSGRREKTPTPGQESASGLYYGHPAALLQDPSLRSLPQKCP